VGWLNGGPGVIAPSDLAGRPIVIAGLPMVGYGSCQSGLLGAVTPRLYEVQRAGGKVVITADEALRALQGELSGCAFGSATVLEVTDGGPGRFLVQVRWGRRIHPHTVVVAADEANLAHDHFLGAPLDADDAAAWARGVRIWLEEELDTGLLRWGQRITLDDGTVAIDPLLRPEDTSGPWYVAAVPLDRPTPAAQRRLRQLRRDARQRHIVTLGAIETELDPAPGGLPSDAGFDVRAGQEATAQGRLISWLQLFPDSSGTSTLMGQLVASWQDADVAQLEHLEVLPQTPHDAVAELVLAGVHAAADAGARRIEHRLEVVDSLDLGVRWQSKTGVRSLDTYEVL
jgi:hypothetical protein